MARRRKYKSLQSIVSEWDALAQTRFEQITEGADLTFSHLLVPNMLALAEKESANLVIDAGCGVGIFTNELACRFPKVVGIDPSGKSIEIASEHFGQTAEFLETRLEDLPGTRFKGVDLITANMVLMDVLDLSGFLDSANQLLRKGGRFVFSITHPWFWPSYYKYDHEPWFEYSKELIVEAPFRISLQNECSSLSTHVHRPLERYVDAFSDAKFELTSLREPMPPPEIADLYPSRWSVPRYLLGSLTKA